MNYELWRTIFQYLIYFSSASILVGTIGLNCCNKKITYIEKQKSEKISQERDAAIKKSNEKADALFMLNRFLSEIDNKIETFYLHLDLGNTIISDNFSNFSCFLYFSKIDVLFEFEPLKIIPSPSKNALFIKTKSVKGHNLSESPLVMSESHTFKNTSDLILDVCFLIKKTSARDFSIRDLHNETFQFIISKEHSKYIKKININVNHWHIFRWSINDSNWKKTSDVWLPKGKKYVTFYRIYNTRHITEHKINYYEQGVQHFEIVRNSITDNLKITKSSSQQLLHDVDKNKGTMVFQIDNKWLIGNNALIEYLPLTVKGDFKIRIFRDIDNVLKVLISNSFSNNVILSCKKNWVNSNRSAIS